MREIKFRFWSGSSMMNHTELFNDKYTIAQLSSPLYTTMQFTGLKDKNGIDIYEGDILEYKNELGKHSLSKIFYKSGGLCYNIHKDDFYKKEDEIYFYESCADMQSKGWITQFEIIGNIYENPELLNN